MTIVQLRRGQEPDPALIRAIAESIVGGPVTTCTDFRRAEPPPPGSPVTWPDLGPETTFLILPDDTPPVPDATVPRSG